MHPILFEMTIQMFNSLVIQTANTTNKKVATKMFGLRHKFKVSWGIIQRIAVNMVNNLIAIQFSPEFLLHDKTMQKKFPTFPVRNYSVSVVQPLGWWKVHVNTMIVAGIVDLAKTFSMVRLVATLNRAYRRMFTWWCRCSFKRVTSSTPSLIMKSAHIPGILASQFAVATFNGTILKLWRSSIPSAFIHNGGCLLYRQ